MNKFFLMGKNLAPWLTPIIPTMQEAELRRIVVQGQSGEKSWQDTISTNKPGMNSGSYLNPSYVGGAGRRIMVMKKCLVSQINKVMQNKTTISSSQLL
jgi:hypothetical protein